MKITTHPDAASFLTRTQTVLEINEACNSLILGVCQRLASQQNSTDSVPCFKTVEDGDELVIAAMMTPPHKLVINAHKGDIQAAARLLADDVISEGWEVPGTFGPGVAPLSFADKWGEITNQRYELQNKLRVYTLKKVLRPPAQNGELRQAKAEDKVLVANWWYAFGKEIHGEADRDNVNKNTDIAISRGNLYLWDNRQPVSMAMKTRPMRNGISISAVYTPPEYRGKRYATACVGALSQILLDKGWKYCALFADLANPISNRVYQKIGYKPVCDYCEYVFLNKT
jgi:predicted GNAT family acetyltransferase